MSGLRQRFLDRIRPAARQPLDRGLRVPAHPEDGRSRGPASNAEVVAEATAHAEAGRLGRSLAILTERLAQHPDDPELLYARASTLFAWGRLRESLEDLRAAAALGLSSFGLHLSLAQSCHLLGIADEAERHLRQAIVLDPESAAAHVGLGTVFQAAARFDDAILSYERAYELAPDRVDCLIYIASCRLDQKDGPGGEEAARRAIARGGDQAKAWCLLGVALSLQDRCGEALQAFERAEEIEARTGQSSETFVMHGFHLLGFGRLDEALELYAQHLPSSAHPGAHAHYGFTLLTAGRFREGWPLYEFRWCQEALLAFRPRLGRPQWNGQDLEGKTVLLWGEQGIGDTIQFVRFAAQLKARGASVVLRVPARLKELAPHFLAVDRVILEPGELAMEFDYYIATLSLPGVLGIDAASIPADVPYLRVDPWREQRWRERLAPDGRFKAGLVWAGNPKHERDRFRSMSLSTLGPLWDVDGVRFYSLQKERRQDDAAHLPSGAELVDVAAELEDFRDTAAAIQALDLVITVDTAVAHVAGALGKPVWAMLPAAGDFRWLKDREDSPWYPTMRLFTQRRLGEWDEVVGRVAAALRNAVHARNSGALSKALSPPVLPDATSRHAVKAEALPGSVAPRLCRVTDTRHGIVQFTPRDVTFARALEWYGEWLQPQLDLLGKLLRQGATVVEAGGGIGVHALALAQMIGPEGHLFVYEADAMLRRILTQNLQLNRVRNQVTVMPRQLSGPKPEDAHARAAVPDSSSQSEGAGASDTIDELLLSHLDLIKINDGAAAREILDGAAQTLWRSRPLLFVAASDEVSLVARAEQAKTFGYRCWRMVTPLFVPGNYNRREDDILEGLTTLALVAVPEEADTQVSLERCTEV